MASAVSVVGLFAGFGFGVVVCQKRAIAGAGANAMPVQVRAVLRCRTRGPNRKSFGDYSFGGWRRRTGPALGG
jgi:hypothetical protein